MCALVSTWDDRERSSTSPGLGPKGVQRWEEWMGFVLIEVQGKREGMDEFGFESPRLLAFEPSNAGV
jgi:hypothetical protein